MAIPLISTLRKKKWRWSQFLKVTQVIRGRTWTQVSRLEAPEWTPDGPSMHSYLMEQSFHHWAPTEPVWLLVIQLFNWSYNPHYKQKKQKSPRAYGSLRIGRDRSKNSFTFFHITSCRSFQGLNNSFYVTVTLRLRKLRFRKAHRSTISTLYIALLSSRLLQWCLTLCDPMDCNLPGSSVHGIL